MSGYGFSEYGGIEYANDHLRLLLILSDSINVAETISSVSQYFRLLNEVIGIEYNQSGYGSFLYGGDEPDSATGILLSLMAQVQKSESINLADSLVNTAMPTFVEVLSTDDTIRFDAYKQLLETFSTTDTFSQLVSYIRDYSETVSVNDTLSNEAQKKLDETWLTQEAFTFLVIMNVFLNESVLTTDNFDRVVNYYRNLAESVNTVDSLIVLVTYIRAFAESFGITEAINSLFLTRIESHQLDTRTYFSLFMTDADSQPREYFNESMYDKDEE